MDDLAEDGLTVGVVLPGVENVLVPEVVKSLSPRHDRAARVLSDQVQEFAVVGLDLIKVMPPTPEPSLTVSHLVSDALQIKFLDFLPVFIIRVHTLSLR